MAPAPTRRASRGAERAQRSAASRSPSAGRPPPARTRRTSIPRRTARNSAGCWAARTGPSGLRDDFGERQYLLAQAFVRRLVLGHGCLPGWVVSPIGKRRAVPGSRPDLELLVEDVAAPPERHAERGVLAPVPAHRGQHERARPGRRRVLVGNQATGASRRNRLNSSYGTPLAHMSRSVRSTAPSIVR
jgi:hypothetical protein